MKLDDLLGKIRGRGLDIVFDVDGQPRVKGDKEMLTPALVRLLKLRREEVIRKLGPKPEQRIVLLAEDGSVEKVLAECGNGEEREKLRGLAEQWTGRTLAAEWLRKRHGKEDWVRFLTKHPREEAAG